MPPIQRDTWSINVFNDWLRDPGNYDHEYVKVLALADKQLTSLPESIGNLTNLNKLYLQNNQLSSLPESIGNLRNLNGLYLHNNQLSSLPESIGNLTSLIELNLQNNQLSSLPESIGNLTNLNKLYLHNNRLSSLPESIGNLTSLIETTLSGNPFVHISSHLRNRFGIPDNMGIVEENVAGPPVLKNIPRNAENAVMMEPIADGNNMVNFHGEYDLGRYYKKSTYNSFVVPKKNPFTRRAIRTRNVVRYKAKVGGRRKTRKVARKTRRVIRRH